jgi:hypothetical protein
LPVLYVQRGGAGQRSYNWAIIFRGFQQGTYRLTVKGLDANGDSASDSIEIGAGGEVPAIADVIWPPSGTDITAYNGDFNPWGDLTNNPLGQVLMTDSQGNQVQPLSTWSDYQDYQTWVACFPTLNPGTYSLNVQDDQGMGQTVVGLVVT